MASLNKVQIIGNLGADPEVRYLPNGDAIANLNVATTDKYKDKNGDQKEATEWHRISFFGKIAEICGQYLKKGSQVYVEGSLRTRKWQDKDGNDRYTTEIRGDRMQMLGSKGGVSSQGQRESGNSAQEEPKSKQSGGGFSDIDDDIPF